MDWTVELVASDGYVRVTTRGKFTLPDNNRLTEDILAQPYWQPGTAVLFDHCQLDMAGASYSVMREATEINFRNDHRMGNGKTAIVMGPKEAT